MTENIVAAAASAQFPSMWQARLESLVPELEGLYDADINPAKAAAVRDFAEYVSGLPAQLASVMVEDGQQRLEDALRITGAPRDQVESLLATAAEIEVRQAQEEIEGCDAEEIHEIWTDEANYAAALLVKHGAPESMNAGAHRSYEMHVLRAQVFADAHDAAKAAEA